MKTYVKNILSEIDKISIEEAVLSKKKQSLFLELKEAKKKVENENSYLIGKIAMCVNEETPKGVLCTCVGVMALDDFESVKPLFNHKNKKFIADFYEWTNNKPK